MVARKSSPLARTSVSCLPAASVSLPARVAARTVAGTQARLEQLLQLDAPGWAQLFADNDVDRDFTRKLDRLVSTWLTQEDYRELREIASKKTDVPVVGAAEAVLSEWINDRACKRLSHLVMGMRFTDTQTPVCYALCNAERAIHSQTILLLLYRASLPLPFGVVAELPAGASLRPGVTMLTGSAAAGL